MLAMLAGTLLIRSSAARELTHRPRGRPTGTIEMRCRFSDRRKSVNGGDARGDQSKEWLKPFDLNTADEASLARLQNIGPERARTLIQHRPYKNWREVEKLPGFGPEVVDILAQAGVQIGHPADQH
jgi:hypothetical protein